MNKTQNVATKVRGAEISIDEINRTYGFEFKSSMQKSLGGEKPKSGLDLFIEKVGLADKGPEDVILFCITLLNQNILKKIYNRAQSGFRAGFGEGVFQLDKKDVAQRAMLGIRKRWKEESEIVFKLKSTVLTMTVGNLDNALWESGVGLNGIQNVIIPKLCEKAIGIKAPEKSVEALYNTYFEKKKIKGIVAQDATLTLRHSYYVQGFEKMVIQNIEKIGQVSHYIYTMFSLTMVPNAEMGEIFENVGERKRKLDVKFSTTGWFRVGKIYRWIINGIKVSENPEQAKIATAFNGKKKDLMKIWMEGATTVMKSVKGEDKVLWFEKLHYHVFGMGDKAAKGSNPQTFEKYNVDNVGVFYGYLDEEHRKVFEAAYQNVVEEVEAKIRTRKNKGLKI